MVESRAGFRRSIRFGERIAVALLVLLSAYGCSAPEPAQGLIERGRRDVLLVTIDTLRADATGFSGAGQVETPWLDRLARDGWVADDAHAHAVMTLPSHASILTGLLPYQHGIRDNAGFTLAPDMPTLATLLAAEGYATAAFVSAFPLDRRFGLGSGFATYDDDCDGFGSGPFTFPERPGDRTVARAIEWWKAHEGRRRLLWVHLFTPHFPYAPEEPWAGRYAGRPYYGDVAMADAQLEPLLAPLLDEPQSAPIVLVTSDHGESLGEHGEETHGIFAYEATLKVPFLVWAPGVVRPGRDMRETRHIDILPTLLDLLGLDIPAGLPGRTLFSAARDGDGPGVYFEALTASINRGWAPLHGRIEDRSKAIRLPLAELYDLAADPHERNNAADARTELWGSIVDWIPAEAFDSSARRDVDPETIERLRSLGYVASSTAQSAAGHDASTDPKNLVHYDRVLQGAMTAYNSGRAAEAIGALEGLLAEQPRMSVAYAHLSFMYSDLGRTEDAVRLLRSARQAGVDNEEIRRKLALSLLQLGRADEAEAVLGRDARSSDPETQSALGRVAASRGRVDEARSRFARALELDPTFPGALIDQGILALSQGRFDDAESSITRGLAADPAHAEGWNALGVIRSRRGDPAGAIEAWRKAVEADPRLADALFNLAMGLAGTGKPDEARGYLERYSRLVQGAERQRALEMLQRLRGG